MKQTKFNKKVNEWLPFIATLLIFNSIISLLKMPHQLTFTSGLLVVLMIFKETFLKKDIKRGVRK